MSIREFNIAPLADLQGVPQNAGRNQGQLQLHPVLRKGWKESLGIDGDSSQEPKGRDIRDLSTFLGAFEEKLTESLLTAVRSIRKARLGGYYDDWSEADPNAKINRRALRQAASMRLSREPEYAAKKRECESDLHYAMVEMNKQGNVRIEPFCTSGKGPASRLITLQARAYRDLLIWQWELHLKVSVRDASDSEVWISAAITMEERKSESEPGSSLRDSGGSVVETSYFSPQGTPDIELGEVAQTGSVPTSDGNDRTTEPSTRSAVLSEVSDFSMLERATRKAPKMSAGAYDATRRRPLR